MTRLQQKVTRKAAKLGYACKYNEQEAVCKSPMAVQTSVVFTLTTVTLIEEMTARQSHMKKCSKKLKI